jgi:hypothetical protein
MTLHHNQQTLVNLHLSRVGCVCYAHSLPPTKLDNRFSLLPINSVNEQICSLLFQTGWTGPCLSPVVRVCVFLVNNLCLYWRNQDPAPFKALETDTRLQHKQRDEPQPKQMAPVTSLQQLVKNARISILDPVLKAYPPPSSDEGEEDDLPDSEELKRVKERAKIRELKRRKIHGSSRFYGFSGLGLRQADTDAVFVREDQEDESAEVDIGLNDVVMRTSHTVPTTTQDKTMEVDTLPTSISLPLSKPVKEEVPSGVHVGKSSRTKRAARKLETPDQVISTSASTQPFDQPSKEEEPQFDRKGKPRPETYKQAWSVEEQHLLERLLEEIPEGAKNR